MDGLKLCQSIRDLALEQYTYFILQTARYSREDYRIGMEAGVDDLLAKPLNPEALAMRLRSAERIIRHRLAEEQRIGLLARFPADNPKQAEIELVTLKNQAEENALHDQLTGLPSRRLLAERLHQETARALSQGTRLALLVADIDNFKQINDGYGHEFGDRVIVAFGQCLRDHLRLTDTVCRWGGDQMALLLTDLKERAEVQAATEQLMRAVKQRGLEAAVMVPISFSLGSAIFPDDAWDPTLLMQQADQALQVAKAEGRDCWREFKGFPGGHCAKGQADLFNRLTAAVAEGRISTQYQPIIDSATQQVVGAEALARWLDERYGWVSPEMFIPLAEEKGLIFKLGHLVLRQALQQLAQWRQRGLELTVSINLSKRQLLDAQFLPSLVELVRQLNLEPAWVTLELTERQSVLSQPVGRLRLEELAACGFRLSMDDFGSGYSSFDLVGETTFSELKIHGGLIRRSQTYRSRRILQAIVEMGRTLDLGVVAEGVEDESTQAMLTALGVHKLQGYLFSKPLQAGAFLNFAEQHTLRLRRAA